MGWQPRLTKTDYYMKLTRDMLEAAKHPAHWNAAVNHLARNIGTGPMPIKIESMRGKFPKFVSTETDFASQNTLFWCEHCGEPICTITRRDAHTKTQAELEDIVKNAIIWHIDEDCYPAPKTFDAPALLKGIPIEFRGRDLPFNVFDFHENCQVWFDLDDRQFKVRCGLCNEHVCTIDEKEVENALKDRGDTGSVKLTHEYYVNTIRGLFENHKLKCKVEKRRGIRKIRVSR